MPATSRRVSARIRAMALPPPQPTSSTLSLGWIPAARSPHRCRRACPMFMPRRRRRPVRDEGRENWDSVGVVEDVGCSEEDTAPCSQPKRTGARSVSTVWTVRTVINSTDWRRSGSGQDPDDRVPLAREALGDVAGLVEGVVLKQGQRAGLVLGPHDDEGIVGAHIGPAASSRPSSARRPLKARCEGRTAAISSSLSVT